MNEEYPIQPTLDKLIQAFRQFRDVNFPRGIPDVQRWNELVRGLTRYEAQVIARAQDYMAQAKIDLAGLDPPTDFLSKLGAFQIPSAADADYMRLYQDYKRQVDAIAQHVRDCVFELGNPLATVVIPQNS